MIPKLSSLTDEDKLKLLLELDGWKQDGDTTMYYYPIGSGAMFNRIHEFKYLTSYDALLPLLRKQSEEVLNEMGDYLTQHYHFKITMIMHEPSQLVEALLVALKKAIV